MFLVAKKVKNPPVNAEDPGLNPGSGRSPAEGHGNPLQNSCLENPVDRGALWAAIYGVEQSQIRLKRLSKQQQQPHKIMLKEKVSTAPKTISEMEVLYE